MLWIVFAFVWLVPWGLFGYIANIFQGTAPDSLDVGTFYRVGIFVFGALVAAGVAQILIVRDRANHRVCPNCGTRMKLDDCLTEVIDLGYRDGWHTRHETSTTTTTHTDTSGRYTGYSNSSTGYNRTVPDRTFYWAENYRCSDCGSTWSEDFYRVVNL
jgi:hypothetical protein